MKKSVVGVDIGATHTKVALLDLEGHIFAKDNFSTRLYKKNALIEAIADCLNSLLAGQKIKKKSLLGIGVGVPGLLDFEKGLVFYFVNIPGWKNIPFKKLLEKKTGLPAFVDNDVKVMALGEITYGVGKGYSNIIYLTLGTGVGGAVIIDGLMRRGKDLVAGEIGHIPINESGPLCNCGGIGCLEAYVGRDYFLNGVTRDIRNGAKSSVMKMANYKASQITPELMSLAARNGDRYAIRKWKEMGEHIAVALTGVVNLLNPELVVIGGGLAETGNLLFNPIRNMLKKRSMKIQGKTVKLIKAKLGNDAGVVGAGELVKRNLKRSR